MRVVELLARVRRSSPVTLILASTNRCSLEWASSEQTMTEGAAVPDWHATLRAERARVVPPVAWCALAERLWPGGRFSSSEPVLGGLGALMDRLIAEDAEGVRVTAVVRRFPSGGANGPEEVRREVATLQVLTRCEAPAPRPLWSDPAGEAFGRPALAMTDLPGRSLAADLESRGPRWRAGSSHGSTGSRGPR